MHKKLFNNKEYNDIRRNKKYTHPNILYKPIPK